MVQLMAAALLAASAAPAKLNNFLGLRFCSILLLRLLANVSPAPGVNPAKNPNNPCLNPKFLNDLNASQLGLYPTLSRFIVGTIDLVW